MLELGAAGILLLVTNLFVIASSTSLQAQVRGSELYRRVQQSGTIVKLRLINADTNTPIDGYDPLGIEATVNVASLPTANLNIEGITEGSVGSIAWDFNGARRVENAAPWALCGNSGSDFFVCERLVEGFNATIKATPYSGNHATGTAGPSVLVSLSVIKKDIKPTVSMNLTIVDAVTDIDIAPGINRVDQFGNTFVESSLTRFINIRANVYPPELVGSVKFIREGVVVRIENSAPFAMEGNRGNDYFAWAPDFFQFYDIDAEAYSGRDGQGTLLSTTSARIYMEMTYRQPVVKKISLLTPKVDVSSGPATALLQLTVQDDTSTLTRVYAFFVSDEEPFEYLSIDGSYDVPPTTASGRTVELNVSFVFPQYIHEGVYTLNQLTLVELGDEEREDDDSLTTGELAEQLNFTSTVEVINSREDLSPPELVSFTALTPTKIDISSGPANVTFKIVAKDDMLGVGFVSINSPSDNCNWLSFEQLTPPIVGTYETTLTLVFRPFDGFPGPKSTNYSLTVELYDAVDNDDYNTALINSTELARRNFPSMIEVINSNA